MNDSRTSPGINNNTNGNVSLNFSNVSGENSNGLKGIKQKSDVGDAMRNDMNKLSSQNKELNDLCGNLEDEIMYLKCREKKIMYLIHVLQNKGYPVQNTYEKELKNVPTMRITEFIEQKEKEAFEKENGGDELDDKYYFSFHTDDSFEPICDGP